MMITSSAPPGVLPHRNDQLQLSIETIAPETAELYLTVNVNPRPPSKAVVSRYARDMAEGHWELGSGSIKFNAKGELRDGQQRLMACIQAGVAFTTVVYRNVTDAAILNTDRGSTRQFHHYLRAWGVANSVNVQSIIVLCWKWDHGLVSDTWGSVRPTMTQTEEWYRDHPEVEHFAALASRWKGSVGGASSVLGAFAYRVSQIDMVEADRFGTALITGANLAADNPVKLLRDRFLGEHRGMRRRSSSELQLIDLAICCKVWNAWVTGQSMRLLSWRRGTGSRESFPDLVDAEGQVFPFPDIVGRDG